MSIFTETEHAVRRSSRAKARAQFMTGSGGVLRRAKTKLCKPSGASRASNSGRCGRTPLARSIAPSPKIYPGTRSSLQAGLFRAESEVRHQPKIRCRMMLGRSPRRRLARSSYGDQPVRAAPKMMDAGPAIVVNCPRAALDRDWGGGPF